MIAPDYSTSARYFIAMGRISTYLPQRNVGVRVLDRWYAAVGIDAHVRFLFQDTEVHHLCLVGDAELLEEDDDLPWIWALNWSWSAATTEIRRKGTHGCMGIEGDGLRHCSGACLRE